MARDREGDKGLVLLMVTTAFLILTILALSSGAHRRALLDALFSVVAGACFLAVRGRGLPAPVVAGSWRLLVSQVGFWQALALAIGFSAITAWLLITTLRAYGLEEPIRLLGGLTVTACSGVLSWFGWRYLIRLHVKDVRA